MKPSELNDYGCKKDMERKMNVIDLFQKARLEAEKRGIAANAIIIDEDIAFSVLHLSEFWPDVTEAPLHLSEFWPDVTGLPLILGMKAAIDTHGELPDDAAFAIFHAETPPQTKDEQIAALREEVASLRGVIDAIRQMAGAEGVI